MAGLVLHPDDLPTAVRCGAVSVSSPLRPSLGPRADRADLSLCPPQASFVIEQFALPRLARDADGTERWNGVKPADRLAELAARGAQ